MKQGLFSSIRLAGSPRVALLLAVAVVLLLVGLASAAVTIGSVSEETDLVEHTLEVEAKINELAALNERIETARRGFLIQPNVRFVEILRDTSRDFARLAVEIEDLTSDNARQGEMIAEVRRLDAERQQSVQQTILTPATEMAQLRSIDFNRERGVVIARRIRALTQAMAETEQALLSVRNRRQLDSLVRFYAIGGISLLLLFAVLAAVILLMFRYNRDLTRAQDRLQLANEGLETAVAARTAELQRANQEIQRFAYIVSHDLRSPLVNVLGFTAELDEARKTLSRYLGRLFDERPELKDQAAWLAVEEDLPEAVGFIRTSTEKMDRLINSILELSRQGRRKLTAEALDMDELAAGVVASLHQRAQDAGATIAVGKLPGLESDRVAVEQILSNLVENALKYLSPARSGEVSISGRRAGRLVQIDVTDNGRGIDQRDHERIFELFRRSGTQDQPGEGIGLANVRALAYRLGGTIDVESELDRGSTFRLSLPAKFVATETRT